MGQFVTVAEVERAIGPAEFARLADPDNQGAPDLTQAERAIEDAEALALSYLAPRDTGGALLMAPVRRYVGGIVLDIAVWKMARDPLQVSEDRRRRYEDAIKLLRDIARGDAQLPIDPQAPSQTPAEATAAGDEVLVASRSKIDWSPVSLSIQIRFDDVAARTAAIARLADKGWRGEMMETLAAIGESQTRRRIEVEKNRPGWQRLAGECRGQLDFAANRAQSPRQYCGEARGDTAEWGASWEFAAVHQDGMTIKAKGKALRFQIGGRSVSVSEVTIPARPFVGMSETNEREMIRIVEAWVRRVAQ